MIPNSRPVTLAGSAAFTCGLIYHTAVRDIRKAHGNAVIAVLLNVGQAILGILGFWAFYAVMRIETAPIRGDFMLYVMSGIFLYMTHVKTMTAVLSSESNSAQVMKHAPMTAFVGLAAAAISALYIQVLTVAVMLFFYHVAFTPVEIANPAGAAGTVLLAWGTGLGLGVGFLALKPWSPVIVGLVTSSYSRVSMVASGKMFVANTLPPSMLVMFDWNPLFHIIDQARGFLFINYRPYYSNLDNPVIVMAAMLVVGLMLEFRTRQSVSASWSARR